jgi:sensor histidine kinase YesM
VALIKEMRQHKARSLKAERIKTELLRRNMQPHFLMNCLTQLIAISLI